LGAAPKVFILKYICCVPLRVSLSMNVHVQSAVAAEQAGAQKFAVLPLMSLNVVDPESVLRP